MSFDADGTPDPATAYRDPDDGPTHSCGHCGALFPTQSQVALHRGLVHPDGLTEPEREAFRSARAAEERALRRLRLGSLGVVVLIYFLLVMAYALV